MEFKRYAKWEREDNMSESRQSNDQVEVVGHTALWMLKKLILIKIIWIFMLLILAKFPATGIISGLIIGTGMSIYELLMLGMTAIVEILLIRWVYRLHISLREIFTENSFAPVIAVILSLPFIGKIGTGIVFGKIAWQLKETQNSKSKKEAIILFIGVILFYVSEVLIPTRVTSGEINGIMDEQRTVWAIFSLLHDISMLLFVICTNKIILRKLLTTNKIEAV